MTASVEKTVAFYRQIPTADAEMHSELFAGFAEYNVSALIATRIVTVQRLSTKNLSAW
jgi:hypothetical protein